MSNTQTTELTEQEPNKRKKRALLLLVGIVAASGVGTLAYGYWTQSGAGSGGATAGTTSALTINQTGAAITGLYPGGPGGTLSGTFTNPNTSPVSLSSFTAVVSDVQNSLGASITGTCAIGNFSISGTPVVGGTTLTGLPVVGTVPSGGAGTWSGLTITLDETNVNQNGCKGAKPVITYAAS
jgi:hypothetical protein